MNNIFRVSFSILEPWSRGDYDEAVKRWMRIPIEPTPAMIDGKMLHLQWQEETLASGKLPSVFGARQLTNPSPELKLECVIDDWIQFVGVVDCMEDGVVRNCIHGIGDNVCTDCWNAGVRNERVTTIHEYKTGRSNSMFWARTMQTRCYQVLTELNGMNPKQAIIHHFNQYTKQVTHSKVYFSDHTRQLATEWIRTYASELHTALEAGGQL